MSDDGAEQSMDLAVGNVSVGAGMSLCYGGSCGFDLWQDVRPELARCSTAEQCMHCDLGEASSTRTVGRLQRGAWSDGVCAVRPD